MRADLAKEAAQAVKAKGKNLRWLQFAKKTKHGYRLLNNKTAQWQVLEQIAEKVSKRYPDYTHGQVVDMLAELVNTS